MKNIFIFGICALLLPGWCYAQLMVKNSTGNVTIGSITDATEDLEVYGDGQIFDAHPFLRFKLNTNSPTNLSRGGLHWKDNSDNDKMQLFYRWDLDRFFIGPTTTIANSHFTINNSNGFVGVNVSDPQDELHIDGDLRFEGSEEINWYQSGVRKAFINYASNDLFIETQDPGGDIILDAEHQLYFNIADNIEMVLDDSGNFGIGTTSPVSKLDVRGNIGLTGEIFGISDGRVKNNILDLNGALHLISLLNPVSFNYKHNTYPKLELPSENQYGFIAQEVEKVLPALVTEMSQTTIDENDTINLKGVNYMKLIPLLTAAIQEQQIAIKELNDRITQLEKDHK